MDEEIESVDVELLRACCNDRTIYENNKDLIKSYMLTEVAWGLLGDIGEFYTERPTALSVDGPEFKTWFRIARHPEWKPDKHKVYSAILGTILTPAPTSPALLQKLTEGRIKEAISQAAKTGDIDTIPDLLDDLRNIGKVYSPSTKMVSEDIEEIISSAVRIGGYEWRLEDLNVAVGPVSTGDLIIVGKRPEVGGTSFVISEITHMVKQLPEGKNVLFVNNEEYKTKIITRLVSASLDCDVSTIYGAPGKSAADYKSYLGGKQIDVMSDGNISAKEVEGALKSGKYGLIVFNTLEKIQGFGGKGVEDYQRIERLGQWARRLALTYGPVFSIAQADVSGEGVKYLDGSMLYKTKTGLQGEADLLIMIGKSNDPADPPSSRYIHVAKNKLPGTSKTAKNLRHIKTEVHFDENTGRYKSKVAWKKTT